jgi:cytochrome c5
MSHDHHPDAVEENLDAHPVKLAIWIGIGAVALVVGIVLLAKFAVGAYGGRSLENDPAMAPAALNARIGPVARLHVEGAAAVAPATASPKPGVAAVAPATASPKPGVAAVAPATASPKPAAATVAAVPPVAAAPAKAGKPDGKKVYDSGCVACHSTGVAGSPKLGDKAAWAPRIKTGNDALYASAIKGKGAMPPKGGNMALADADVKAAVDFLVGAAK